MTRRTRNGDIEIVIELPRSWRRFCVQRGERQLQPVATAPRQPLRNPHVSHQTLQQVRSRIAARLDQHGGLR